MADFKRMVDWITARTGIVLTRGGLRGRLERFVASRMRELGMNALTDYIDLLESDLREFENVVVRITVPHTWFFRDRPQIDAIRSCLVERARAVRSLQAWVPACASGEDAFTLALVAERAGIALQVMASDLCERTLERGERAVYPRFSLRDLPREYEPYLIERAPDQFELRPEVRRRVRFVKQNLLAEPLRASGGWDVILCRNAFIYFSDEEVVRCAERLGQSLAEGGTLFCGAGELICERPRGLVPVVVGERVAFRSGGPPAFAATPSAPRRTAARASAASPVVTVPLHRPPGMNDTARSSALRSLPLEPNEGEPSEGAPSEARQLLERGLERYWATDYAAALELFRAALVFDEELWPAVLYAGFSYENLGIPERAAREFRHTAELLERRVAHDPSNAASFLELGRDVRELLRRKNGALR